MLWDLCVRKWCCKTRTFFKCLQCEILWNKVRARAFFTTCLGIILCARNFSVFSDICARKSARVTGEMHDTNTELAVAPHIPAHPAREIHPVISTRISNEKPFFLDASTSKYVRENHTASHLFVGQKCAHFLFPSSIYDDFVVARAWHNFIIFEKKKKRFIYSRRWELGDMI